MHDLPITVNQANWLVINLNKYKPISNDNGWHSRVLYALVAENLAVPIFDQYGQNTGEVQAVSSPQAKAMIAMFSIKLPTDGKIQISNYDAEKLVRWLANKLDIILQKNMESWSQLEAYSWAMIKDLFDCFVVSRNGIRAVNEHGNIDHSFLWLVDSPAVDWIRTRLSPDKLKEFFPS